MRYEEHGEDLDPRHAAGHLTAADQSLRRSWRVSPTGELAIARRRAQLELLLGAKDVHTALISARWVNAWGKLPRWRPVAASISSAYNASGLANDRSFSHSPRARSISPISTSADTSQNEQIVNVPSSLAKPSSVCLDAVAQHQAVLGQLVGDREHGRSDSGIVGRKEPNQRHQQQ